jgi:hypothetical protein
MKLSVGILLGQALAGEDYKKCLNDFNLKIPVGFDRYLPGPVPNGHIKCKDNYCENHCDPAYHWYNGHRRTKCKPFGNSGKWGWTNRLGECKTCGELKVNRDDIQVR